MFQPPRTVLEMGKIKKNVLLSSWKQERYYFIALLLLVHKYHKKSLFLSVQEISRGSYQGHERNRNREKLK